MYFYGLILSVVIIFIGLLLQRSTPKIQRVTLQMLAWILFLYKLTEYTIFALELLPYKVPLEFSTMSYFIFSMTIIFNWKKTKSLAAFMAFISGIGYLISFAIVGDHYVETNGLMLTTMAFINHAILFLGSMLMMIDLEWHENEKKRIMIFTLFYVIYVIIMNQIVTFTQSYIFIRILLGADLLKTFVPAAHVNGYLYLLYFLSIFLIYQLAIYLFMKICLRIQHKKVNV